MAIQVINENEFVETYRDKVNDNFTELQRPNEPSVTSGTTPVFTCVTPDGLTFSLMPQYYSLTVQFHADGIDATLNPNSSGADILIYENTTKRANVKNGQVVRLVKIDTIFMTIGAGGGDELVSIIGNTAGKFDYTATAPTNTTRLNYSGYLYATRMYGMYFADYAEAYNVIGECEAGDLIAINVNLEEPTYTKNIYLGNSKVIGIVSDSYHQLIGIEESSTNVPIALEGRVLAKVIGIAHKGDFLIGSNVVGAMEVATMVDETRKGAIIAQVLENKTNPEIGKILVKVVRM